MQSDYVIVGAGPAAIAAAETIRKNDATGSILILSGENHPPYSRMAIPYLLTGAINEQGTYLREDGEKYRTLKIDLEQATVEAVDPGNKTLSLNGGKTCNYGKLLIATGASPVKPPVKGLDLPNVHHCWTIDDAKAIAEAAGDNANVTLMGAGFIGCIILEALSSRGANLTVVEAEDRMVPRMMNDVAGNMIKDWCQKKGINIITSARVTSLSAANDDLEVSLDNNTSHKADLVVVATGVRANISFVEGSGIKTNEGIETNEQLETSAKDVFAAGDCAEGPDFSTNGWSVQAIQPTATEHGHIAGLNMTGANTNYQGSLNMNVLDTVGLISSSFGLWQGVDGGDTVEVVDAPNFRYTHLAFDGDVLIGAVTLGRTNNIGVVRGLIQSKTKLGKWKNLLMENPNRLAEAYIANTQ